MEQKDNYTNNGFEIQENNHHQQTTDMDDIDLDLEADDKETRFNSDSTASQPNQRRSGPWSTTSSDAYSRKVHKTSSVSLKNYGIQTKTFIIFGVVATAVLVLGFILGLLIGMYAVGGSENGTASNSQDQSQPDSSTQPTTSPTTSSCLPCVTTTSAPCNVCKKRSAITPDPTEETTSVFAPLTVREIDKVYKFMFDMGLAETPISIGSTRILFIYLHPPEKTKALDYTDKGGPFPGRFAKVHVARGDNSPPDIMEYKIGPLHVDNMEVVKLWEDGEIHFNRRTHDPMEQLMKVGVVEPHLEAIKQLLVESFDGRYFKNDIDIVLPTHQATSIDDRVSSVHLFFTSPGAPTLRVLPVQCLVHHPGTNLTNWHASDFYYLQQGPFASGEELYEAYSSGKLEKIALPDGYFQKSVSEYGLTRNYSLPLRENGNVPPPRTYEPEGARYTVHGQKVSWMDWSFHFSADPIRGPGVFDVKFKNQRIAYEISLQDITLIYASSTTGSGMTPAIIADSEYLLGNFYGPRGGVDCPDRAGIINSTTFLEAKGYKVPAACIYEEDGQRPLWRHFERAPFGLANHYLVVRAPMVLGNYDYTAQWKFYLDGHVETSLTASGYLYTSFWDPENPLNGYDNSSPFGFRIGEYVSGSVHDHAFLFKVDVDILDRNNSMEVIHWRAGDIMSAVNSQTKIEKRPPMFPFNTTRYVEYEMVEKEGGFNLNPQHPQFWTIVNERERNAWGVKRGYRIIPIMTTAAEIMPPQFIYSDAWSHLKYHCAVTKRKDEEPYASYIYDFPYPFEPLGGLNKIMDDDSIRDEDLVAWITAKFIHMPTAEDSPMTMGVERGFSLAPFNFFDRSQTFDVEGHYTSANPYPLNPCYEEEG